jgi:hypothetical protein
MSNQHHSAVDPRRLVRWLAAVALAASLGGCVAYPGYDYGPGYYGYGGGYPVVVAPAPVVGFGYWGGGGGEHGGGHEGGHWH